ncbi:MAG: hypothetical protein ACK4UU_02155 [Fimbriimonadales bacterium]
MMSAHWDDQASSLRVRLSRRRAVGVPAVPLVCADFLLFKGVRVELPPATLVWHWRPSDAPAVGWDLQARLHVRGLPARFRLAELQRWRELFPEWRLVGRRLELLQLADVAYLWLKTGAALTPRLEILLQWLCKNRPDLPIIVAGIGSGAAARIQNWVEHRYSLRGLSPAQTPSRDALSSRGFYRLIRWAAHSESAAAHPQL